MPPPIGGKSNNPNGRPLGSRNRLSRDAVERAQETGLLPHEILLGIGRGEMQIERSVNPVTGEITEHKIFPTLDTRITCLNMCAPFYAPKMAQVQHKGVQKSADQVSDDELLRIATDLEPMDGSERDDVIDG